MNHEKFKVSLETIYETAKEGISKEDKQMLLDELDEMAQMLEEWKKNNKGISPIRKAS